MEKQNIEKQSKAKKIIEIDSILSRFEVPPLQDILVIGKEAPIGRKAMERAIDFMSQGNYKTISFESDQIIEAVIVKKSVLRMASEKILVDFLKEEIKPGMCSEDMLKLRLEILVKTKKSYQF